MGEPDLTEDLDVIELSGQATRIQMGPHGVENRGQGWARSMVQWCGALGTRSQVISSKPRWLYL